MSICNHSQLKDVLVKAMIEEKIDYSSSKNKLALILDKIKEISAELSSKGTHGYFAIVVPPMTYSLLEKSKDHSFKQDIHLPIGPNYVTYAGILDKRYAVYIDNDLEYNKIVVTLNNSISQRGSGVITIENYK